MLLVEAGRLPESIEEVKQRGFVRWDRPQLRGNGCVKGEKGEEEE